jgi:hypothetical protein
MISALNIFRPSDVPVDGVDMCDGEDMSRCANLLVVESNEAVEETLDTFRVKAGGEST